MGLATAVENRDDMADLRSGRTVIARNSGYGLSLSISEVVSQKLRTTDNGAQRSQAQSWRHSVVGIWID